MVEPIVKLLRAVGSRPWGLAGCLLVLAITPALADGQGWSASSGLPVSGAQPPSASAETPAEKAAAETAADAGQAPTAPTLQGGAAQVLFAPGGAGALLWSGEPAADGGASWVSLIGDQPSGSPAAIAGARIFQTQIEGLAAAGSGDSVILTGNVFRSGAGQAAVVTGTLGGAVGAPVTLSQREGLALPVAANGSGRYVLFVGTAAGAQLVTGRIGGSTRHTARLPGARGTVGAVAIDAHGNALAAWSDKQGHILARLILASGRATPPRVLGELHGGPSEIHAVLTNHGEAVVGWVGQEVEYFQSCDCQRVESSATFRVARGGLSGHFGHAVELGAVKRRNVYAEPGDDVESRQAMWVTRVGAAERVVVGWRAADGGTLVARFAMGVGFKTRHLLSVRGANVELEDLVAGPAGELLALASETSTLGSAEDGPPGVGLSSRCAPAGLAFGAVEGIAAGEAPNDVTAAVDPATGVAVAAWQQSGEELAFAQRARGC